MLTVLTATKLESAMPTLHSNMCWRHRYSERVSSLAENGFTQSMLCKSNNIDSGGIKRAFDE